MKHALANEILGSVLVGTFTLVGLACTANSSDGGNGNGNGNEGTTATGSDGGDVCTAEQRVLAGKRDDAVKALRADLAKLTAEVDAACAAFGAGTDGAVVEPCDVAKQKLSTTPFNAPESKCASPASVFVDCVRAVDASLDTTATPPTCRGGTLEGACDGKCIARGGPSVLCEGGGLCEGDCTDDELGRCACLGGCNPPFGGTVECDGACATAFTPLRCRGGRWELAGDVKAIAICDALAFTAHECDPDAATRVNGDVPKDAVATFARVAHALDAYPEVASTLKAIELPCTIEPAVTDDEVTAFGALVRKAANLLE